MKTLLSKLHSTVMRDILSVLAGNAVSQGVGFLTLLVVSRDLGPEQYGIFSLLIAIFTMAIQVSDFGMQTSYVKHVSKNISEADSIFFTVLVSKIIMAVLVAVVIFFSADAISAFFFDSQQYAKLLRVIVFALVFHAVVNVVSSHLQALQKFKRYAMINVLHSSLKLGSIVAVAFLFEDDRHFAYFVYAYSFAAVLVALFVLTSRLKHADGPIHPDMRHLTEIYRLGFWVFISSLATLIIMRLDVMMLQKMSTSEEVGYYSVAMNFAMIFPLLTGAIVSTLLPKMEQFLQRHSIRSYIFRVFSLAKYLVVFLGLLEVFAPFVIVTLFGQAYAGSVSVFQILVVAFTFGIVVNPISLVMYSIGKAYLLTLMNWLQLLLNYFGNLLLIPLWQADGAAASTVVLKSFGGFFVVLYLLYYKDEKKESNEL